jgi:hypothetical protein
MKDKAKKQYQTFTSLVLAKEDVQSQSNKTVLDRFILSPDQQCAHLGKILLSIGFTKPEVIALYASYEGYSYSFTEENLLSAHEKIKEKIKDLYQYHYPNMQYTMKELKDLHQ